MHYKMNVTTKRHKHKKTRKKSKKTTGTLPLMSAAGHFLTNCRKGLAFLLPYIPKLNCHRETERHFGFFYPIQGVLKRIRKPF